MSKTYSIIFFLLIIVSNCLGQDKKTDEMYDVLRSASRLYLDSVQNLNYLIPLKTLKENKNRFKEIDPNSFYDYIGFLNTAYSYLHETDSIIQLSEKARVSENSDFFNPIPFLEKEIGDSQMIMLNEAHHVPGNRLFAESLLKLLRKKGFRYLAVETLYWSDTLINKRKYPISTTGYYTREPYFANFIRSAIKEGFTILPYEQEEGSGEINEREQNQANNIIEILTNNPSSKVFVYAGYSHIKEKSLVDGIKWMAERIKDSIDVDPFTIDQTTFITDFKEKVPLLINLKRDTDSLTKTYKGVYDVSVLNTEENENLHFSLGRRTFKVDLKTEYPDQNLILQAYITKEYNEFGDKAISFDQRLINKRSSVYTLYLAPDEDYMLLLKDENSKVIKKMKIEIEEQIVRF